MQTSAIRLSDWWAASRWPKRKCEVGGQTELAEAQAMLCLLSEHFRQVSIIRSNHDSRARKLIAEQLPIEMVEYLDIVAPSAMDPLQFLTHGLNNVEIVAAPKSGHAEFGFLCQIGDAVFTHAETYSTIPGRAVGNVAQWLKSFAEPEGIVHSSVRCVVHGHTHQGATQVGNFGVLQIEGGCLCEDEEYIGSPKIRTPRPWSLGWTVILQDSGRTDFRDSRFKPFE